MSIHMITDIFDQIKLQLTSIALLGVAKVLTRFV